MIGAEVAFLLSVVGYAAGCTLFFTHLWRTQASPRAGRAAPIVLGGAALAHAAYVVAASLATNVCPIKSANFVLSFAALLGTLIYLALCGYWAVRSLGAFVAPVALTFLLTSRFMGGRDREVSSGFLAVHITVNLLGVALFLLASAAALLYLIEERRLKQRRPTGLLGRLPPLDTLDRAVHGFLLSGFPFLTLGIVTGTVWAHKLQIGTAAEIVRSLLAYATWSVFASVLVLRTVLGWRGRRAAYGTLAGFLFAIAVLVVYLVRTTAGGTA